MIAPSTMRVVPPCRPAGLAADDDPCASLWLDDGRRLSVAPLHPHDAAATQAFIAGLSPDSRYRRFHVGIPMLPPALLARLVDIDQVSHVALAARVPGLPALVAEARYVVDEQAVGAEFAVTVADAWQGLGLGRQLLQRLARRARSQGLRLLHGDVLADNRAMRGLVERLGGTLLARADEPGVLQARFDVAAWLA